MSSALVVVTAALFVGVVYITVWGWRVIPADGRFPISFGVPPSVDGSIGKRSGLVLFLLIDLWLLFLSALAASVPSQMGWIGLGLAVFFLAIEYRLIHRLTRNSDP